MEKSPVVTCTLCEIEPKASSYCHECEEFLCNGCSTYHGLMKKSKSHKLEPAGNYKFLKLFDELMERRKQEDHDASSTTAATAQEVDPLELAMAEIHNEESTMYYCVNCDEEISSLSTTSDEHASHEFLNLDQCIGEFKDMLNSYMSESVAYQTKAQEAILDLEMTIRTTVGSSKERVIRACTSQFNKLQYLILEMELEGRKQIVAQTIGKAKEMNVKRTALQRMKEKSLALINMLKEGDDKKLFSNRKELTKDYFQLRGNAGILLDDGLYKEYVERDWHFESTEMDESFQDLLKNLRDFKMFNYTKDGLVPQEILENRVLLPVVAVPVKPNSIESIFEKKYCGNDELPNDATETLNQNDSTPSNGDTLADVEVDTEMPTLEVEAVTVGQNKDHGFYKLINLNLRPPVLIAEGEACNSKGVGAGIALGNTTLQPRNSHPLVLTSEGKVCNSKRTRAGIAFGSASLQPLRRSSRNLTNPRPGLILLPKPRRPSTSTNEKETAGPSVTQQAKRRRDSGSNPSADFKAARKESSLVTRSKSKLKEFLLDLHHQNQS